MDKQVHYIREANINDEINTYKWNNYKLLNKVGWDEYCAWFSCVLSDPNYYFYILTDGKYDKGQIIIKMIDTKNCFINYSIAEEYKCLGLEEVLLRLAENRVYESNKNIKLHICVNKGDVASEILLKELNYDIIGSELGVFHYCKLASLDNTLFHSVKKSNNILYLTNNRNSINLYRWIKNNTECNVCIFSDPLTVDVVENINPLLIISYNYSHIISRNVLNSAERMGSRAINLHISLLPWNKGSNPNFWSFIDDSPKGVTIHKLAPGLDSGNILYQETINFNEKEESLRTSYDRLHIAICDLFKKHWKEILSGNYKEYEQIGKGSYHNIKMYNDLLKEKTLDYDKKIIDLKREILG